MPRAVGSLALAGVVAFAGGCATRLVRPGASACGASTAACAPTAQEIEDALGAVGEEGIAASPRGERAVLCGGTSAPAPVALPAPAGARCPPACRTEVILSVPLWIPSVTGTFASGDSEVESDLELGSLFDRFADVVGELEFGFLGSVEVRRGRWSAHADAFALAWSHALDFEGDGGLSLGEAHATILRADLRYAFAGRPRCGPCERGWRLEARAGARYYEVGFDLEGGDDEGRDVHWWDPVVGIGGEVDLSSRWKLLGEVEAGGFGISASDLSLWASVSAEHRFSRLFAVQAGWSFLALSFEEGAGDERVEADLRVNGPFLALVFHL